MCLSFDGTDVNNYRMDELSEGDMLSSNFWGRLSDTAVPSIVDDVKGFESRARRAQNEDCGHERAATPCGAYTGLAWTHGGRADFAP